MGRRKSNRKAPPKRKLVQPLDKVFACPFCNHEKSCDVKMEYEKNTAHIKCNVCSEDFQTVINCKRVITCCCSSLCCKFAHLLVVSDLTQPIDVYNEWIDECEKVNN